MEIQDYEPSVKLPLEKIGFRGVRRRVTLNTPEGEIVLDLNMDVLISIDGSRRGAHLSRNIEALDLTGVFFSSSARSIEEYLELVAQRLLDLHNYAVQVEARARTVYYIDLRYHDIVGIEPIDVDITVVMNRDGERLWITSVKVSALSVCPSAQLSVKEMLGIKDLAPSHVQRVIITGKVTTNREMARIEDIARALVESASAPTFTRLKRWQEAKLVIEAHKRPLFAEDIARNALCNLANRLGSSLSPNTLLEVEVDSLESIHPHNVYAYARNTIGEILAKPDTCI